MAAGLVAALLVASQLPLMSSVFDGSTEPMALLSGAAVLVVLGMLDDRFGLDAPTKFAGQALAGAVMALQGIAIVWLPIDGTLVLDPVTSVLLTVLVVVVAVNAINFIDGLDGLAAGIVGIGSLAFFAYSYLLSFEYGFTRATLAALVSAILAGMCAGFLPAQPQPGAGVHGRHRLDAHRAAARELGDHPRRPARPQRRPRARPSCPRCCRSCCPPR